MPTTEAGKAVSALNSIQHGILAQTAAIPGVERLEDWQAHRQGLIDSLAPEGALELCLAERAAVARRPEGTRVSTGSPATSASPSPSPTNASKPTWPKPASVTPNPQRLTPTAASSLL